jgi:hypothetical protein
VAGALNRGHQNAAFALGPAIHGTNGGTRPLIPKEYVHYDLHTWLFKKNPLGLFAATNPDEHCECYDFSILEQPTKMVMGP